MRRVKLKELLPVILLLCVLVYTFTLGAVSNILLQPKHYAAALLVVVSLITYFYKSEYYKKVLLFTLAIGTFNVLVFTPNITIVTFGIGSFGISIQPFSFLILLIFLFQNRTRVSTMLGFNSREQFDSTVLYLDEEKFEKLKEKYSDRSVEELNTIIADRTYSKEAVEAAKLLVQEKTLAK